MSRSCPSRRVGSEWDESGLTESIRIAPQTWPKIGAHIVS